MTVTLQLNASQAAAGAPIEINAALSATDFANDSYGFMRIGTSVSSSPPSTFAGFAHTTDAQESGAVWDNVVDQGALAFAGGVAIPRPGKVLLQLLKRLDSDYAAGKYLWFVTFASATPSGGDAPTHISPSYHIT